MDVGKAKLLGVKTNQARRSETTSSAKKAKSLKKGQSASDTVSLSGGKAVSEISSKLESASNVRMDKVHEIGEKVKSGNYDIQPEKIAAKMVDDVLGLLGKA